MSTPWIAAFAVLSVVALVELVLLLGVLRNIGSLEYRMRLAGYNDLGTKANDIRASGPTIGSLAPAIRGEPLNDQPPRSSTGIAESRRQLMVFLSSSCRGCQQVVDPLNEFAREMAGDVDTMVVMKCDVDSAHRFLAVFEVAAPVYHEGTLIWPEDDPIRFVPYWALYDQNGRLLRHGVIDGQNGTRVLTDIVRKEVTRPSERVG